MSSSLPEPLRSRPATLSDAEAVNELIIAADVAVQGWSESSVDELLNWWRRVDPGDSSWLVFDGRLVAYGQYFTHGDHAELDGFVHPEHRGQGLGSWLVGQAETRARADEQRRLLSFCLGADDAALRLFAQHGFREARRYYRMLIDLDAPPPAPDWPPGLRPATFRREDARVFYDALLDAFADEWNFSPDPYERWVELRIDAPDYDPTLWFLVWDGGEVAAVLRGEQRAEYGWIGAIGVRKAWRRRGIARALLRHAFGVWYDRGTRRVALGVDAQNPTGATHVYEQAGMSVGYEAIAFEKALE
jgi:mycothiol synthase